MTHRDSPEGPEDPRQSRPRGAPRGRPGPAREAEAGLDYDVLVVGSGFGGAVSALRLTEKGYRVGVLEAGRRFARSELPKNSWALRDYLWAPRLGLYGIQRIHLLGKVMILAGAGVGGGSLNYANTLYVPPPAFFRDPQWREITDWRRELAPYYGQARRMLGVRTNPTFTDSDRHLKAAAERMGVGDTFHLAPVGVFFGDAQDADGASRARPGQEVPDPYFGGAGPARRACLQCGECMTGCRHGAKNTLNENYLHLAERAGAEVHPLTTVTAVAELPGGAGYAVTVRATDARWPGRRRRPRTLRARYVILAAGTYGTQTLLHRMRDTGTLPRVSARLGSLTRTNSEALVGARTTPRRYRARPGAASQAAAPGTGEAGSTGSTAEAGSTEGSEEAGKGPVPDFTRGVAITSSIRPDADTHIQPVRYGRGSNAMGLLSVKQFRRGRLPKLLAYVLTSLRHPLVFLVSMSNRRWSERTIIGLVMQSVDNSLITYRKRRGPGRGKLAARQGHGAPNPDHLPQGEEAARRIAEDINGFAGTNVGELFGAPMTAHFLGGCSIGADPERGVVDPYHRLFGHPGISVVDGSAVCANPGVNPALTITAQAERAMALWPNKGQPDPRPPQGAPYVPLTPVAPARPAVPATAFAALRVEAPAPAAKEANAGRTERAGEEVGAASAGRAGSPGRAGDGAARRAYETAKGPAPRGK
ncbi:GMC oxidoreductase [Streptomyces hoynatensis]|uniref:Cholesterol oxidase n=1 Tax=Streptomyces hoynatensis TaxID=1141874 RepID=A0A3A9ZGE7_9ACTN|nr:GMC family oxidoreductase [Streptomyces hoynatensis]RKN46824.1 GMC family oxidoreductase [Streptomyces hoynatensis]